MFALLLAEHARSGERAACLASGVRRCHGARSRSAQAGSLRFAVIGDSGTGSGAQNELARLLAEWRASSRSSSW
jgi:hypothetical protein